MDYRSMSQIARACYCISIVLLAYQCVTGQISPVKYTHYIEIIMLKSLLQYYSGLVTCVEGYR